MKKILFVVISFFAIGLLSFANFNNSYTVFASESTIIDESEVLATYTYSDSTCEEYYGTSANAIDNVVSANIVFIPKVEIVFNTTQNIVFYFLSYGITGNGYNCNAEVEFAIRNEELFGKIPTNMGMKFEQISGSGAPFWFSPREVDLGDGYYLSSLTLYSGRTYKLTISGSTSNSNGVVLSYDCLYNDNLENIVDMQSLTNFNIFNYTDTWKVNEHTNTFNNNVYFETEVSYYSADSGASNVSSLGSRCAFSNILTDISNVSNKSILNSAYDLRFTNTYDNNMQVAFESFKEKNHDVGSGWLYDISPDIWLTTFNSYDYKGIVGAYLYNTSSSSNVSIVSSNFYIDIVDFEILIDMPTYRSQNSLILYNYDYDSMLKYANNITYRLYRDKCFYDVVYSGSVPNKQVLMIDNPNVQNKTFSNYIFLNIDFDSVLVPNTGVVDLGFDFNFGNFIEPFPQITVNNSKQTFDRPPLPTDLTPRLNFEKTDTAPWFRISLYFPVIKYVEYAFLWLLFYAPVVGDCTAFLYTFFNKFLAIFNIVLDLPMGTFVLSFIAFILCFKLFASFLPFASDRVSFTFKNISNNISNKRKENKQFEEKIKKQNLKKDLLKKKSKKIIRKEFKKFDKNTKKKFK